MATRLVKNLRSDYLSCPICLEQFKTPKTLPCEHAFCERCLIDHVALTLKGANVQCPVCRENVKLEESYLRDIDKWVQTLPTDTLLSSLVETLAVHERRNPEYEYSDVNICAQHKKSSDAFCFTHAVLICWECAARDHRHCSIDSATKAKHVIPPLVETLKTKIDCHLKKSRDMCKSDENFATSKKETVASLDRLERNWDSVFTSVKRQISLLRGEIELYNRSHLEQRSRFYDLVTFLLDMNCTLDTIDESEEVVTAISCLEQLKEGVAMADEKMAIVESSMHANNTSKLSFILDEDVDMFLKSYASIGFIDVSCYPQAESGSSAGVLPSIAHILRREPTEVRTVSRESNKSSRESNKS